MKLTLAQRLVFAGTERALSNFRSETRIEVVSIH